jgi:hypothetical protein
LGAQDVRALAVDGPADPGFGEVRQAEGIDDAEHQIAPGQPGHPPDLRLGPQTGAEDGADAAARFAPLPRQPEPQPGGDAPAAAQRQAIGKATKQAAGAAQHGVLNHMLEAVGHIPFRTQTADPPAVSRIV